MCVELTHISIHGNNLHTTTKDPIAQSDLPYMGKRSRDLGILLSLRKSPLYQGIQDSSLLLYKQPTLTFLRYANSPQILHSWVLRDSSITILIFGGFLASIPPMYTHWYAWGQLTHWRFCTSLIINMITQRVIVFCIGLASYKQLLSQQNKHDFFFFYK